MKDQNFFEKKNRQRDWKTENTYVAEIVEMISEIVPEFAVQDASRIVKIARYIFEDRTEEDSEENQTIANVESKCMV
jgi:hypothetical protein